MATLAPSAASRFAIAAPMPREPPVMSATFSFNLDMRSPFLFCERFIASLRHLSDVAFLQVDLGLWEYQPFRRGIGRLCGQIRFDAGVRPGSRKREPLRRRERTWNWSACRQQADFRSRKRARHR